MTEWPHLQSKIHAVRLKTDFARLVEEMNYHAQHQGHS